MNLTISRREARRQDRRDAILAVAKGSFMEHGYAATSMSTIAAKLGGSKGTLWSYFPSKEALFTAVLDSMTMAYHDQLQTLLDPSGDVRTSLTRFGRGLIERIVSHEAMGLHRLIMAEAGRFPELGAIFYEGAPHMMIAFIAGCLQDWIATGRLRQHDTGQSARVLISLFIADCQLRLACGVLGDFGPAEMQAEAEAAVDVFMRAYGA
jgi:TetR/AcrR family transcriptional repressor of mexJK operon